MQTQLGRAIEKARRKLNLSEGEYARRVGVTRQCLLKIVGGGGVRGDTLAKLQRAGGISVTKELVASLDKAA